MLAAFVPLWTITILGWAATRFGVLNATTQAGLTSFAFMVAIPAVIFTTLVEIPFGELPLVPLAVFAISAVVVGALVYGIARGRERGDRIIVAMASAYVNSGNLGIPVAIYVLGDASLVVAIVAFQTVVVTPFIIGLLDVGGDDDMARWRRIVRLPLRAPVVAASVLGVLFTLFSVRLPEEVLRPLDILGAAAAPTALFALGMALHVPDGRPDLRRPELSLVVAAKIVLQPVVAYLVGRYLFHLDAAALIAVTIFAGLPTAQNTFIYATQYNVPNGLSRDAVLVTSVLSLLSLSLILWLLA